MSACVALLACVTLGCEGSMSFRDVEGGEEPGVEDAGGGRGEDAGTDAGRVLEPAGAVEMPLKRLTPLQYHNAVRALFDGLLEPGFFDDADRGAAPSGYSTEASANVSTDRGVRQLFDAAEKVGVESVDVMDELLPCAVSSPDDACVDGFIRERGARAFRRPLTDDERALLRAAFDEARADGMSYAESVGFVISVMLQMPQFLYLVEIGEEEEPGVIALTDHEIAARLSFMFLDSLPDAELRRAAEAGELRDPENIGAQARRLLEENPRASITRRLIKEWLHLDERLDKSEEAFPGFGEAMEQAVREELERSFALALADGTTLDGFLGMGTLPIDASLAAFYGVEGFEPGEDGWAMVELPTRHQGLLTRPYFLGSHASTTESSHVKRGYTVIKQLLCAKTGTIPKDAMSRVPVYPSNSTARQKSEVLRGVEDCAYCHVMLDNIGLSFEHYDAVGQWRERSPSSQGDQELDVSGLIADLGQLAGKDVAGRTFEGVSGLTDVLVDSTSVEECIPRQWFRFTAGRVESGTRDERVIAELTVRFMETGGSLSELLVALTMTKAFRTRALAGEEAGR